MNTNKKGGITTSTVMGVGGLVIVSIVILVVISTINGANLLGATPTVTETVTSQNAWLNQTGFQLNSNSSLTTRTWTVTQIKNTTDDDGQVLLPANYSVSATGLLKNASLVTYPSINVTYTYTHDGTESAEEYVASNLTGNLTSGLGNISSKIPTILLVVAVIFLFGALVLLIRNMGLGNIGGGSSL